MNYRLECLKLARGFPGDTIERATTYAAFVMRSPGFDELEIECLRLAHFGPNSDPAETVTRAQAFFDFALAGEPMEEE